MVGKAFETIELSIERCSSSGKPSQAGELGKWAGRQAGRQASKQKNNQSRSRANKDTQHTGNRANTHIHTHTYVCCIPCLSVWPRQRIRCALAVRRWPLCSCWYSTVCVDATARPASTPLGLYGLARLGCSAVLCRV